MSHTRINKAIHRDRDDVVVGIEGRKRRVMVKAKFLLSWNFCTLSYLNIVLIQIDAILEA